MAQAADRIEVQRAVGLPIAAAAKPMPLHHAEARVFSSETQRSRFSRQTSAAST